MRRFQKTYKQKHPLPKIDKAKYILCSILAGVLKLLIILKKICWFILLKILPIFFTVFYKVFLKYWAIFFYRLYRQTRKRAQNFFENSLPGNKAVFLFTNRYVIHIIAILIIILVAIQNFSIRGIRAEDFGRLALFAKLNAGSDNLQEQDIIEEIILNEPNEKPPAEEKISALTELNNVLKTKIITPYNNEDTIKTLPPALTQGGTALVKPNIGTTFDTPKPREETIEYAVQSGDTVFSIAEEYNVSVNTILWTNKLSSRSIIRPGNKLKILPVTGVEHKIAKNETIGLIAKKYKVPEADILEINKLIALTALQIGQLLIIPDGAPLYAPPPYKPQSPSAIVKAPNVSGFGLFWPTACRRITQTFKGWRHSGLDIACNRNSPIYAAEDGAVEKAGWSSAGYGYHVIIRHNDGKKTLYGHMLKNLEVRVGQTIAKGQLLGYMGSTGHSSGNHLHFEVIVNGSRYNPFNYL